MAKVLAWDRHRRVRPVALQDPQGAALLRGMSEEERMASWHLVTPDGRVLSAGGAVPALLQLLPAGGPAAALAAAMPAATDRGYRWVADHRGWFGRLVTRGAADRARLRIEARTSVREN